MGLKKHLILLIALIVGFSLIMGTVSATTTQKTTYITKSQLMSSGNYYSNKYVKISITKPYVNGYVFGTNPVTGKYEEHQFMLKK